MNPIFWKTNKQKKKIKNLIRIKKKRKFSFEKNLKKKNYLRTAVMCDEKFCDSAFEKNKKKKNKTK